MTVVAEPRRTSPPYEAYAAITGVFLGGLGVAGLAARLLDRNPACQTPLDFLVLSAASFKAARTVAREEVTSFLREPFVRGEAHEGAEDPVQSGDYRQAIGELVTCSRCGGTWAAAFLASTQILAPRFGRILTWSLAAAGVNDWLQAGFAALTQKASELEIRSPG
ncbi:MAG TPA: DUF1360 domain-containing protein [Gaiellaceae bacterium]|jgi:hypothetical protein|nr:DUF1360 domain-containing protein [Gaiellaceae bacterium]